MASKIIHNGSISKTVGCEKIHKSLITSALVTTYNKSTGIGLTGTEVATGRLSLRPIRAKGIPKLGDGKMAKTSVREVPVDVNGAVVVGTAPFLKDRAEFLAVLGLPEGTELDWEVVGNGPDDKHKLGTGIIGAIVANWDIKARNKIRALALGKTSKRILRTDAVVHMALNSKDDKDRYDRIATDDTIENKEKTKRLNTLIDAYITANGLS